MEGPTGDSVEIHELDQNLRQADNGNQATAEGTGNDQTQMHLDIGYNNPQNQQRSLVDDIAQNVFRYQRLDRTLERPHLTGIAFSGTVGMGIFVSSGELISVSGSVGCVVAYLVSAFIVTAVLRSLAEMVSVRPFSGALIDFPATFVDPALGFAVGVTYW